MICKGCLQDKPVEEYTQRKDRSGRFRPYCKACVGIIAKARYAAHKRSKPFMLKCSKIKSSAQSKHAPFDLTPEYIESVWTGVCPVFKIPIHLFELGPYDEFSAELDRIVPALGYIKGNVAFLSRRANRLKNNVTISELQQLLDWMVIVNES